MDREGGAFRCSHSARRRLLPDFGQAAEHIQIQGSVAITTHEPLDTSVLHRFARLHKAQFHTPLCGPVRERPADALHVPAIPTCFSVWTM